MENNNNGITISKFWIGFIIPIIIAIGSLAVAMDKVKQIDAMETRIDVLEQAAWRSGDDHMLLIQMKGNQEQIAKDLVKIKTKMGIDN